MYVRTSYMKRLVTISAILLTSMVSSAALSAQEQERHETLTAVIKTDSRRVVERLGKLSTGLEDVRRVISPLGEGDPIR